MIARGTRRCHAEGDKGSGRRGRSPPPQLQSDRTSIVSSPGMGLRIEIATADAGLVGDDNDLPAQLIGQNRAN